MTHTVTQWLEQLGLAQYAEGFERNAIDPGLLSELTDADLERLGVNALGHRKKLLRAIEALPASGTIPAPRSTNSATPMPLAEAIPASRSALEGERRQLTVLFCDMVGFTELANRVDPEVLQGIIRSYEDACAVCITRYEGYVFQRLGDGIVAFFGYPLAHEGEAERAIHAGLAIIAALSRLDVPNAGHLTVRIGIATGLVVVSSAEQSAVGDTMNLASRLQGAAQPGGIVVSERVHRLAGGAFDYDDLGEQTLKGIAHPTRAYRIVAVSQASSRFEAANQGMLTPLVGREHEISMLLERWQQAQDGEGQVVLLCAEPGIGKSRILNALRERLEDEGAQTLRFQCSPYYVNSAFWPSIDNFERALKFGRDESPESKLDKLEALVVSHFGRPLADVRFVASMLSIPCEARYGLIPMTPQKHKEETMRSLVDLTEAAARKQRCVMLYEDLHWVDPTTLEMLDLLIDRVRSVPLLIVLTHRPEFDSRWSQHGHVIALNLSKLTRAQSGAMVSRVAGAKALPSDLLEQILTKTDGVPLFVEELTKSILESGELTETGDRYEYAGASRGITIPATLRDSLMARLDRFMPVKEIAQIGAAIGREFSYELIVAVAPLPQVQVGDALARLTESGLAFRRGTPPDAVYTFKHALVQDAAYDSLLKSRRQDLHGKIARVIQERFPAIATTEPEVLALHYTRAGLHMEAVPCWLLAGQRAVARSANLEAVAHLTQGIGALQVLPEDHARVEHELDMQISLGSAQIAMKGYSAAETEKAYLRSRELLAGFSDDPRQFAVLHGLCMVYWNRAQLAQMLAVCEDMLARAERQSDSLPKLVAHRVTAAALNPMGRFAEARAHAEEAAALYDPELHQDSAHQFGHDMAVGAYWHLAVACMFLGEDMASREAATRASALAKSSQNANTMLYDSLYLAFTGVARGDWAGTQEVTTKMIEQAVARNMALWEVFGRHHLGCVLAATGKPEAALEELRRGRQRAEQLNNTIFRPMTFGFEALALADLNRFDDAIGCLDRATRLVEETEERWWEPELHRYRGLVERRRNGSDAVGTSSFQRAIEIARRQGSKLFESNATTDLAHR